MNQNNQAVDISKLRDIRVINEHLENLSPKHVSSIRRALDREMKSQPQPLHHG